MSSFQKIIRDLETQWAPGVPFESLSQEVFVANQNVSCFNLGPFPCVCYSLPVACAVLGPRKSTEVHGGSEPRVHCHHGMDMHALNTTYLEGQGQTRI